MAQNFIPAGPYDVPSGFSPSRTSGGGSAFLNSSGDLYIRDVDGYHLRNDLKANNAPPPTASAPAVGYTPPPPSRDLNFAQNNPVINVGGTYYKWNGSAYDSNTNITAEEKRYAVGRSDFGNLPVASGASPIPSVNATGGGSTASSSISALGNLGPGSSGDQVKQLQQWLVSQGYMTQAQMDTGPGTYGAKTTAAVAKWQADNNIDTKGNSGYFGPISKAYLAQSGTGGTTEREGDYIPGKGILMPDGTYQSTRAGDTGGGAGGETLSSDSSVTGNPSLDSILKSLQGLLDNNKAVIPPGLQITPALTQQFLTWAHQAVDPQTQQLIQSEITNINASLKNLATQYETQKGEVVQNFGTNLATEQNQAGATGTAFSGQRNLNERNMAASTNRTLSALGANTAYQAGAGARATAANVGTANAGGITFPSLTGATVGIEGGSRGSMAGGPTLDFSYNPSLYTMGAIPSTQEGVVGTRAADYLKQYTTLAGNNSARSMSDLIGGLSGLPAGYAVPSNLM